jgi:putative peptidoglycan lipid II flippase
MLGALLGKILGFVREVLQAKAIGASVIADGFRGAMTAVLMPISPLQGDMVPSTLVPLHKEWTSEGRRVEMISSLTAVFMLIALFIAIITYSCANYYVDFLVGGFGPQAKALTIKFVHVMVFSMPASVVLNCFACIELSQGRTRLMAYRASVQNVSIIVGILIMMWYGKPVAIAYGFAIAMNLVTLYGYIMLALEREVSIKSIRFDLGIKAFGLFFKRVKPLFAQPLFDQGNNILEKVLSSALSVGTLASLDYARTITDTAVYFISQPIGFVVLGQSAVGDMRARVRAICRPIIHISMPASLFIIIFAQDIVKVVFQRGAFQQHAIALTTGAIQGICVGMWATTLGWILVRMLNVQHRNGTAAKIFVAAYVGNMLVNLVTYKWYGTFGIGLGEATRGFVLVAGTALALKSGRVMLELVLQAIPISLVVAGSALLVRLGHDSPFRQLVYGSSVFCALMLVWLTAFVPEIVRPFVNKIKRKVVAKA